MRKQLELDNSVATELAGSGDAVLRALQDDLDCDVFLRGNVLTLDGDEIYVDTLVIKFEDDFVMAGDALKGKALMLFRRIFTDRKRPSMRCNGSSLPTGNGSACRSASRPSRADGRSRSSLRCSIHRTSPSTCKSSFGHRTGIHRRRNASAWLPPLA